MKLRPLSNRIIVRQKKAEEVSAGGIVIPDSAKDAPAEGEVIAVGPGLRQNDGTLERMSVEVGHIVLFTKNAGQKVVVEGEELLVLNETDILTVVEV